MTASRSGYAVVVPVPFGHQKRQRLGNRRYLLHPFQKSVEWVLQDFIRQNQQ
jgi:hypothetical protein